MTASRRIPVIAPYPWDAVLRYLAHRATPVLEQVDSSRYLRGGVSVTFDGAALSVAGDAPADGRIERLFDSAHDPSPVMRRFRKCPVLGPRAAKVPGLRAPGCWDPFALCLRVVLGQQVSVKGAHTLMGRLVSLCPQLQPEQVAAADLARVGVPGARVRTLRVLAEAAAAYRIRFDRPWPEVADVLRGVPGIGPWTVGYLAIRLGRDADAFPETDLGLLRAARAGSPAALLRMSEKWRPFRAYAAMYLWNVD